jgi:hypothetical protein
MATRSDHFDQELFQRIDEVLLYHWDPVGVARDPLAREHYAGFVPEVFAALLDDADEQRVMELLLLLETEFLGLAPRPSHARRVAEILVDWRAVLEEKYTGASSY